MSTLGYKRIKTGRVWIGTVNSGIFPITVTDFSGIVTACTVTNPSNVVNVTITHPDPGYSYHVQAIQYSDRAAT